jgi:hypothetical protein
MASETCRVLLQLLINILPSCITLVLYIYIIVPVLFSTFFHEPNSLSEESNCCQLSCWNHSFLDITVNTIRVHPDVILSTAGH